MTLYSIMSDRVSGAGDYKVVHACDACFTPDLNCQNLACGRHLCFECNKKYECPCADCAAALPAFRLKKILCPACQSVMDSEAGLVCHHCQDKSIEFVSTPDLCRQLVNRLFPWCASPSPNLSPNPMRVGPPKFDRTVYRVGGDYINYHNELSDLNAIRREFNKRPAKLTKLSSLMEDEKKRRDLAMRDVPRESRGALVPNNLPQVMINEEKRQDELQSMTELPVSNNIVFHEAKGFTLQPLPGTLIGGEVAGLEAIPPN